MKLQFKPETTVILFNQFTFTIIVLLFKMITFITWNCKIWYLQFTISQLSLLIT